MFDGIAPDYDRLNHLMSLGVDRSWRRRALREIITPGQPQRLLDIACGTGDFSLAQARRMHPDSHITGLDLSEGMLAVMREKVAKAGLEVRISCEQGDSEAMRFPDGSFDCATIAFGIRNFSHREAALEEILRVLKPGGIFVMAIPAARHLWELKAAVYDHPYENEVKDYALEGFTFLEKRAEVKTC